jgi:putative two-component system response regulator
MQVKVYKTERRLIAPAASDLLADFLSLAIGAHRPQRGIQADCLKGGFGMAQALILCIEHDAANQAVMRNTLAPNHRLVFAHDSSEARFLAETHAPALILLSDALPDIDCYTLIRQLRTRLSQQVPAVIVLTSSEPSAFYQLDGGVANIDFLPRPFSPLLLRERVKLLLSLAHALTTERSLNEAVHLLSAVGHYGDTHVGVHAPRMAAYACALAQAVGWEAEDCARLTLAAPLHDLGMIGVPEVILSKPGTLNGAEWTQMRQHTTIGYELLVRNQTPIFQLAASIALHHHERWDGTGYPTGLRQENIPEAARICAIADVFDALTSRRPYKEAWPVGQAIDAMRLGRGSHFDPTLLDRFLQIMPTILDIGRKWQADLSPRTVSSER